jgi:hypothetical protein
MQSSESHKRQWNSWPAEELVAWQERLSHIETDTCVPVIKKKSDNHNYCFDKYVRPTEEGNICFKLEFATKIYTLNCAFAFHIFLPHRLPCTLGYNLISMVLFAVCSAADTRVFISIGEINRCAVVCEALCKIAPNLSRCLPVKSR